MKKFFIVAGAFALPFTPAHAETNREATLEAYELAWQVSRMCIRMLNETPGNEAAWWRRNTKTADQARLGLTLCQSYMIGLSDGVLKRTQ